MLTAPAPAPPASLEKLARAYKEEPNTRNRAALQSYAARHKTSKGALALLALASEDLLQKRSAEALARLKAAAPRLKEISDYTAFLIASAQFDLGQDAAAIASLGPVFSETPKSPLAGRAAILAANAWTRTGQPRKAVDVLKAHYSSLTQPEGDMALAVTLEAAGDSLSAAKYYQRVYYGKPLSTQAGEAKAALARLKASLARAYPEASPRTMLARARALLRGGDYDQAERELQALAPSLASSEREAVLVAVGEARYLRRDNRRALEYLESLQLRSPDADAERFYYIAELGRRLNNLETVRKALRVLSERHPRSKWRLQTLVTAGNHYLLENDVDSYTPLYQACYESFPDSDRAPYCHWKIAFAQYLNGNDGARAQLEQFLKAYPDSDKAPAALYFLARLAERDSGWKLAQTYYDKIAANYPNYFYAVLARNRLHDVKIAHVKNTPAAAAAISKISLPKRTRDMDFEPNTAARWRISRARLLASAALDQYAEIELRYGASAEDQPQVMALELARLASARGEPHLAIRYIKRYAPGYLSLPLDGAPVEFWKLAFPFPYRQAIESYSRRNGLDPYLVAALIRQESEFDARAVSRAKAYGLTQVLPSTGRMLSRQLGIPRFKTTLLFRPDTNIRIGTYYVRLLVQEFDGSIPAALAAYNAGKSRASMWLGWGEYREPAEFIETVPFTETRNYIQAVMRNADIYRRIYSRGLPDTKGPLASN